MAAQSTVSIISATEILGITPANNRNLTIAFTTTLPLHGLSIEANRLTNIITTA
jgi:uncharacterized membrane protein